MKRLLALLAFIPLLSYKLWAQCSTSNEKILFSPEAIFTLPETGFTNTGVLVAGGTAYQPNRAAVASFIDNNTNFGWFYTYSDLLLKKIAVAGNNDIFVVGSSTDQQSTKTLMVMRLTSDGNIVWVKRLQDSFSPDSWLLHMVEPQSIVATSDGGVVICGFKEYQQPNANNYRFRSFILKLDRYGEVAWTREDTNNSHDEHFSLVEKGGTIFVAGTTAKLQDGVNYGTLMNLNLQTGALISLKGYQLTSVRSNLFRDLHVTSYGFLIGAQAYSTNGYKHGYYILKLDHNGNVISQKQLNFSGSSMMDPFYEVMPTPDGGCLVWKNDKMRTLPVQEARLYKLDQNLDVEWKRYYAPPAGKTGTVIYKAWPEGGTYKALGMSADPDATHNNLYSRLFFINSSGYLSGCTTESDYLDIKDSLTYTSRDIIWDNTYAMSFVAPFTRTITKSTLGTTKKTLCTTACNIEDFSITGDTVLCGKSVTTLKANKKGNCALDFTWEVNPDFADIIPVNDSTIRLNIKKDGADVVTVKWRSACTTIEKKIKITTTSKLPSTPVIGKDTSICNGDVLQLVLHDTYKHVLWSDGSGGNRITVNQAGSYWVKVSDDNTCFVGDTLVVKQVYARPYINIHENTALCLPDPIVLMAGGTDLKYIWQDGSTGQTFTVETPGVYWVAATNSFGCVSSDTLHVNTTYQKPANFLSFADTAACVGQYIKLTLNQAFKSYNWNNGASHASSYTVNKPGTYTVSVTDFNGCIAREDVLIRDKGCAKAIYFPNAFHPTGINKTFRPLIQGVVPEMIHLTVYNRWGELVFESKDASKGWNGNYKNKLQNGNTFVWYCRYRYTGEAEKVAKGTVILIR